MYTTHSIDRARIRNHILSSYTGREHQRSTLQRAQTEPIRPVSPRGRESLRPISSSLPLSRSHTARFRSSLDIIPTFDVQPFSPDLSVHPDADLQSRFDLAISRAHKKSQYELFTTILFSSWTNALLVFVSIGITLHFVDSSPIVNFITNFLAIIPLAGVSVLELLVHLYDALMGW